MAKTTMGQKRIGQKRAVAKRGKQWPKEGIGRKRKIGQKRNLPKEEKLAKRGLWPKEEFAQPCFAFQRVTVQKGMLVIAGIHVSVAFINKGSANLGVSVRLSKRKRLLRTKETKDFCGSRQYTQQRRQSLR